MKILRDYRGWKIHKKQDKRKKIKWYSAFKKDSRIDAVFLETIKFEIRQREAENQGR